MIFYRRWTKLVARLFQGDVFGDTDPKKMPPHFFMGALRTDLATAQRADVSKQSFSVAPRHWYVDAEIACCECQATFVFTAAEQRFWYEERRFYVDSFPTRCAACRADERQLLELRKRYDRLIAKALGRSSAQEKKEVIAIIDALEAAAGALPEKILANRNTLNARLAKASNE